MNIGTLYLVATPIGNLGDFSPRARQIMSDVDFIAAEDTRVTKKLLNALNLPSKPMISYFEHNRRERGEEIVKKLLNGENCALVTDAGTPAISDPGEDLVALCSENNISVQSIPGCCAAVCALAVSGLPTGRWCFEGFLSVNKKARKEHLDSLLSEKRTMIFYEAPHKLLQTLHDMRLAFGDNRKIAMCREITKIHEESLRMTLSEAEKYYTENSPRGEYVLVIEGNNEIVTDISDEERIEMAILEVKKHIEAGETLKDSVKLVSAQTGVKKNILYKEALNRLS